MFNSDILDVAIGMIFIYLLLSLMCSAANEIIELMLKKRAIDLERGIRELLVPGSESGTADIVQKLYDHALVNNLFGGTYAASRIGTPLRRIFRTQLPSYIPARNFALALMDLVGTVPAAGAPAGGTGAPAAAAAGMVPGEAAQPQPRSGAAGATVGARPPTQAQLVVNVSPEGATEPVAAANEPLAPVPGPENPLNSLRNAIASSPLLAEVSRRSLITLVDAAGTDVAKARENIENWYNSSMDRVSSWYKRRAQLVILLIGVFVAIAVNVDTITVAKRLSTDKQLRESLVDASDAYAKANAAQPSTTPEETPTPEPTASPEPTATPEATPSPNAAASPAATPKPTAEPTPAPKPIPTPLASCVTDSNSDECRGDMEKVCQDEESDACRIARACTEPGSVECRRERKLIRTCRDEGEDSAKCKYLSNEQQLRALGLPIGWDSTDDPKRKWPGTNFTKPEGWFDQLYWHWLGWLLTALAISLGAPFWFDLLNKFIVIRSAVKPHEKSPEEESKD